jgi:hypothetical protein
MITTSFLIRNCRSMLTRGYARPKNITVDTIQIGIAVAPQGLWGQTDPNDRK